MYLLTARVHHTRHTPKHNAFTYGVYYVDVPITPQPSPSPTRLFSLTRRALFSMRKRDHGAHKEEVGWHSWIVDTLTIHNVRISADDSFRLIAHPRVVGFAFNPISFWLLIGADNSLRAVVCEVHNTFDDAHIYVHAHRDSRPITPLDIFEASKSLYVSPFNSMEGSYTFTFNHTPETFSAHITYFVAGIKTLTAVMTGTRTSLSSAALMWAFIRYPFMTLMVVARIHLQAAKVWARGLSHTLHLYPGKTRDGQTRSKEVPEEK